MAGVASALARELFDAQAAGRGVPVPPSAREGGCTLDAAYAVEAELRRMRRAQGRRTVGRKVGYANKAVWRALKLQTLVWASMYDDTVHEARDGTASLSLAGMRAPRIEPEIVLKVGAVPAAAEPAAILAAVEWLALGFEIVDCPYPDWKLQPADFVASFGLHAALVVGAPQPVQPDSIPELVDQLAAFTVRLSTQDAVVEEGAGRNALRSPALCLAELVSAIVARPEAEPLEPGEIVSTGTLTAAQPIAAGEEWHVEAVGLGVEALSLRLT